MRVCVSVYSICCLQATKPSVTAEPRHTCKKGRVTIAWNTPQSRLRQNQPMLQQSCVKLPIENDFHTNSLSSYAFRLRTVWKKLLVLQKLFVNSTIYLFIFFLLFLLIVVRWSIFLLNCKIFNILRLLFPQSIHWKFSKLNSVNS